MLNMQNLYQHPLLAIVPPLAAAHIRVICHCQADSELSPNSAAKQVVDDDPPFGC
jgi:hypothetical protein